jgi:hypothetical protein
MDCTCEVKGLRRVRAARGWKRTLPVEANTLRARPTALAKRGEVRAKKPV